MWPLPQTGGSEVVVRSRRRRRSSKLTGSYYGDNELDAIADLQLSGDEDVRVAVFVVEPLLSLSESLLLSSIRCQRCCCRPLPPVVASVCC